MAIRRISNSSVQNAFPTFNTVWDQTTQTSSFDSLGAFVVGPSGQSTITFSNIPQTYTHLQLRILAATNRPTYAIDNMFITLNGDTGTNYSFHSLEGNGSSASSGSEANNTDVRSGTLSSSAAANTYTATILDIFDYTNGNKYKTTRSLSGFDVNGTVSGYGGFIQMYSSHWRSTSAITQITLNRQSGSNFIQYSHFALYGIK